MCWREMQDKSFMCLGDVVQAANKMGFANFRVIVVERDKRWVWGHDKEAVKL